jgi:DNA-binding MarR family transcriptional regulator
MINRKKIIEEIAHDFHAMKNKIHAKSMELCKGNITHSQRFVLFLVGQKKELTIKDVSQMLGISSSASSQLVNELVKHGYVVKKKGKEDQRESGLMLSQKGKKQIIIMKREYLKMMSELFTALSDAELESFLILNRKIVTNI